MHPALSIVVFTAASGAGYGLLALTGLFAAVGLFPAHGPAGAWAAGLALALVTGGLLASTAHLGRPERAWRALSQWRTSWLSREGLLALLAYIPAGLFLLGWTFPETFPLPWRALGLLAALLAAATVYSTGKIYATLRTIPNWSHGLTVPAYLLLGALCGALLAGFVAAVFGVYAEAFGWIALLLAAAGGMVKLSYWRDIDRGLGATDAATATGLGPAGAPVRLLDGPTTSENYVMREMGYRIARRHSTRLRGIAIAALFGVPAMASLAATMAGSWGGLVALTLLGAASGALGVAVERWLFFAEARHVVTAYYGESGSARGSSSAEAGVVRGTRT